MPWKCQGICHDYYYDDEPKRLLTAGDVVCPFCARRPLREQFDMTREVMQGAIVLFRCEYDQPIGADYEAFEDDADQVAHALRLTTTMIGNTWMAGFPFSFLEEYLPKLIAAGHRVAICERDTEAHRERFLLRNVEVKRKEKKVFTGIPKGRQKPLLRGLGDCRGQLNLFPGMDVA